MAKASQNPSEYQLDVDKNQHFSKIMGKLNQMRTERRKCDVIIKVDGKEIHVHRNVMMAGSDYFDAMFSHDTVEERSGVMEMKNVTFPIMKKLVTFIYTGKISITEGECEPLLYAATMIQLTEVCDEVVPFLESHLNSASFFRVRQIGVKFNLKGLQKVCDQFALENLDSLAKEKEFALLEVKFLQFLVSAESFDEDTKIAIILQWIKADVENRGQHFLQMTNLLDHAKISSSCKKYLLENEELCYSSVEFMKTLCLGAINEPSTAPRPPTIVSPGADSNAILIFDKSSNAVQAYRPSKGSMTKMQPLREEITTTKFTAVTLKGCLYVLMANKKFFKIDIGKSSDWVQLKDMLDEHGDYLRATSLGDFVYVVGNKSMERFNSKNGKWSRLSTGNVWVDEAEIVEYRNDIYVIGGKTNLALKDVNRLDLITLVWSPIKPMQVGRQTPSAVVCENKIFVAGGILVDSLSSVEYLAIENEIWTSLTPMINTRDEFRLCCVFNQLFAVGNGRDLQCTELYDFKIKKWKIVEGLPKIEIEAQAAVAVFLHE